MGAGGSKAAAAQKAASRAAVAAKPAAESAAAAASTGVSSLPEAVIAAERQRAAEMIARQNADPSALPAEHRSQNDNLVQSMNQVMSGMQQYQYEVYRNPEVDRKYSLKKKSKEEKAAELVGRLGSPTLKALLEDHARGLKSKKPLSAAELARRYGADPDVLEHFLKHNNAPVVQPTKEGRYLGSWPDE